MIYYSNPFPKYVQDFDKCLYLLQIISGKGNHLFDHVDIKINSLSYSDQTWMFYANSMVLLSNERIKKEHETSGYCKHVFNFSFTLFKLCIDDANNSFSEHIINMGAKNVCSSLRRVI
jgi:hypothetical protein